MFRVSIIYVLHPISVAVLVDHFLLRRVIVSWSRFSMLSDEFWRHTKVGVLQCLATLGLLGVNRIRQSVKSQY